MCLVNSVYLSGSEITAADIVMFHAIHDTVKGFSFQEKDQFVNLSQWFHNLQQDPTLRRGKWRTPDNSAPFTGPASSRQKVKQFFLLR